jgi:ribonuclease HI
MQEPTCNRIKLLQYFGPVIIDPTDIYWLGANRGTNNTGELSGFATALLHLQADGGHETAAICYDSKYAANTTDGTWNRFVTLLISSVTNRWPY